MSVVVPQHCRADEESREAGEREREECDDCIRHLSRV